MYTVYQDTEFRVPHCRVAVAETIENPNWSFVVHPSTYNSYFSLVPLGKYAILIVKQEPPLNTVVDVFPTQGVDPITFRYYGRPIGLIWMDTNNSYGYTKMEPDDHFLILDRWKQTVEYQDRNRVLQNALTDDTLVIDTAGIPAKWTPPTAPAKRVSQATLTIRIQKPSNELYPDPVVIWQSTPADVVTQLSDGWTFTWYDPDSRYPLKTRVMLLSTYSSNYGMFQLNLSGSLTYVNGYAINETSIRENSFLSPSIAYGRPIHYPVVGRFIQTANVEYDFYTSRMKANPNPNSMYRWPFLDFMRRVEEKSYEYIDGVEYKVTKIYLIAESDCTRQIPYPVTEGQYKFFPYAYVGDYDHNIELYWEAEEQLIRDFFIDYPEECYAPSLR